MSKGDFTRDTFRPEKHYSRVHMQQGRVQLDADWNEAQDIHSHLRETGMRDVIGPCGAPQQGGGFRIATTFGGSDLVICPGPIYVHGILCELAGPVVSLATASEPATEPTVVPAEPVPDPDTALQRRAVFERPTFTLNVSDADLRHLGIAPGDAVKLLYLDSLGQENEAGPYLVLYTANLLSGGVAITFEGTMFPVTASPRLRRETVFVRQPDFPGAAYPTKDGAYFAYLDVWERHLTWLDDPEIRETALGGPDTATRVKNVWQVKLWPPPGSGETVGPSNCLSEPEGWLKEIAPSTGRLRARTQPQNVSEDPCIVPESAGFTGLQNQLYRVEIHRGGTRTTASFKWSRENGSIVVACTKQEGNLLSVGSTGRDAVLGIRKGDWVELIDDGHELRGEPGTMAKVADVRDGEVEVASAVNLADYPLHPKLRRWEREEKALQDLPPDGWFPLEHGIEVQLSGGTYRTGDYWLIPARAFIGAFAGDIEWPRESDPAAEPSALPSHGAHHYCKLAVLKLEDGKFTVLSDCRPLFPPLTELLQLVPGCTCDQEALPGEALPERLQVTVILGKRPVPNAGIRFWVARGGGTLLGSRGESDAQVTENTDADGLAFCGWQLGLLYEPQRVNATLIDAAGAPFGATVCFTARHSLPVLHIRCGEGQEARPGQEIPADLEVAVEVRGRPIQKPAKVRFAVVSNASDVRLPGAGGSDVTLFTADASETRLPGGGPLWSKWVNAAADLGSGLARCRLRLGPEVRAQQVEASLAEPAFLDPQGNPMVVPVCFTATLSLASEVQYDAGTCLHLQGAQTVQDALDRLCRNVNLSYVGGGGQSGSPLTPLTFPLEVRAANGRSPQAGATVRFSITQDDGKGLLSPQSSAAGAKRTLDVSTDTGGVASCFWRLDGGSPAQRVRAELADAVQPAAGPVDFDANIAPQAPPRFFIENVLAGGAELLNDSWVEVGKLVSGLDILCTAPLAPEPFGGPAGFNTSFPDSVAPKPVLMVTLDLPWRRMDVATDRSAVVAFQPLQLQAKVWASGKTISWRPTADTGAWLHSLFGGPDVAKEMAGQPPPTVKLIGTIDDIPAFSDALRVRLTLEGNFVWTPEKGQPTAYLAGEALGRPMPGGRVDLVHTPLPLPDFVQVLETGTAADRVAASSSAAAAPAFPIDLPPLLRPTAISGNRSIAGRFEMWFWIVPLAATVRGENVAGNVKDEAGAALPGFTVLLNGPGVTLTQVTNSNGQFRFQGLAPGAYTLVVNSTAARMEVTVKPVMPPDQDQPALQTAMAASNETSPAGLRGIQAPAAPASPPAPTLADVRGIGPVALSRLQQAGITHVAEVAAMEPAKLAQALQMPETRARNIIENAKLLAAGKPEPPASADEPPDASAGAKPSGK